MPTRLCARSALVLILAFAGKAVSQEVETPIDSPEKDVSISMDWEEEPTSAGPIKPRGGFRYYAPSGFGYRNVLLSAEGFLPLYQTDKSLLFGDVRTLLHDGQFGFNLGGGHRLYSSTIDKTIGIYSFFDNMNTGNRTVSQITGGVDVLGNSWEARGNLYYPLDRDAQVVRTPLTSAVFVGNQLLSNRLLVAETALTTVEAETGHLLHDRFNLWGFIGGYHMDGEHNPSTWGWKTRLEMRVSDKLTVDVTLQHDDIFKTNLIMSAALLLPGSRPSGATNLDRAPDRLAFPVYRRQNAIIAESNRTDQVIPLSANTNQAFHVVHVDPTVSGGIGTFEQPFQSIEEAIAAAGPNSVVYVQPIDQGYSESLQLLPGQIVLGAGSDHYLSTMEGPTLVPHTTDARAKIVNSPGNAITLADNSIVSGFDIVNPAGAGIFGENVLNPAVVDTNITGGTYGVRLINATGNAFIQNSTIQNTLSEGVYVSNSAGSLYLQMSGNNLLENVDSGLGEGAVSVYASEAAELDVVISGSTLKGSNTNGLYFEAADSSKIGVEIASTLVESNTLDGVSGRITDTATGTFNATSSTFKTNNNGISLRAEGAEDSTLAVTIGSNLISENRHGGIKLVANNTSILGGTIAENSFDSNSGDGLRLLQADDATLQFVVEDNTFTKNLIGVSLVASGNTDSVTLLTLSGNSFDGQLSHGVDLGVSNGASMGLSVKENTIANSAGHGIRITSDNSSLIALEMTSNQISGNHNGALIVANTDDTNTSTFTISGNAFSSNKINGLSIQAGNEAILSGSIYGNSFASNVGNGVNMLVTEDAQIKSEISSNAFADNQAPGILLTSKGTGMLNEIRVSATGNTITGSVNPGFQAETLESGRLFLELADNDSSRGYLIKNAGDDSSRVHLALSGNDGSVSKEGTILSASIGTLFP